MPRYSTINFSFVKCPSYVYSVDLSSSLCSQSYSWPLFCFSRFCGTVMSTQKCELCESGCFRNWKKEVRNWDMGMYWVADDLSAHPSPKTLCASSLLSVPDRVGEKNIKTSLKTNGQNNRFFPTICKFTSHSKNGRSKKTEAASTSAWSQSHTPWVAGPSAKAIKQKPQHISDSIIPSANSQPCATEEDVPSVKSKHTLLTKARLKQALLTEVDPIPHLNHTL